MQTALLIILLLAILAGAVFVGHYGWVSDWRRRMPAWGWLMWDLVFSLPFWLAAVLVFYSSRAGFDEPPQAAQEKKHRAAQVDEDDSKAQQKALVLAI